MYIITLFWLSIRMDQSRTWKMGKNEKQNPIMIYLQNKSW
jgi:hypothetical protein